MSNVETAYEYFLQHGFTPAQSSGIVGNLMQESNVNPESQQPNGPGRGIAQWSAGGRWIPSLMTGNPSADLNNQLDYVLQELQSNPAYGLSQLEATQTPVQAATVFGKQYEMYGIAGNRFNYAQDVYQAAQTNNWPSVTSGSPPAANGGGSTGSADSSSTSLNTGGFINSVDSLLNPQAGLLHPAGTATLILGRGGVALWGLALIVGGLALIVLGTSVGRKAVEVATA